MPMRAMQSVEFIHDPFGCSNFKFSLYSVDVGVQFIEYLVLFFDFGVNRETNVLLALEDS